VILSLYASLNFESPTLADAKVLCVLCVDVRVRHSVRVWQGVFIE